MHRFFRPEWTPTHPKVAAGFAIGLAGAGVIYAAAATSAGLIADSFATTETVRHGHAVEFDDGLIRTSSRRENLLAQCERLQGSKRRACISVINGRQKRAANSAPE